MLFWTVVFFVTYSLVYFVVSQRKMQQLRKVNAELRLSLQQKGTFLQKANKINGHYENKLVN
jgi:hypothetical protein